MADRRNIERFPFKTEVRIQYSQVTVTYAFSLSAVYSFLRPKSLCMRILAKTGILTHKCVYVIVQSQQKRKGALLSHRKRRRTHIDLLFEFQRLKISCFKTAVLKSCDHATDVVPRLGTSSWFCPGWSFCFPFTLRVGGV